MVVKENPSVKTNFYKKQCLPVIAWNKRHLSKQVVTVTGPAKWRATVSGELRFMTSCLEG